MSRALSNYYARMNDEPMEIKRGHIYYIEEPKKKSDDEDNEGLIREETVGCEQRKNRPAVIVSNDAGNTHSDNVTVVYLTTQIKKPLPTHTHIESSRRPSTVLCESVSTISKDLVGSYCGQATDDEMKAIDKALAIAVGLEDRLSKRKLDESQPSDSAPTASLGIQSEIKNDSNKEMEEKLAVTEEKLAEATKSLSSAETALQDAKKESEIYKGLYNDLMGKMFQMACGNTMSSLS